MKEIRATDEQPTDPERIRVGRLDEHSEAGRLENAAESVSRIEQLRPEVWANLSETRREWCLREVGRRLSSAYECPAPEFIGSNLTENERGVTLGEHSDFNYLTRLNRRVIEMNDPSRALETYCHEFRHAYQHEMAGRYDSGYLRRSSIHSGLAEDRAGSPFRHLCHDEAKAAQWAENFGPGNYVPYEADPERYEAQPVEADAREFARRVKEEVKRRQ